MKYSLRAISAAPLIERDKALKRPDEFGTITQSQRRWGYVMAAIGAVLFSMKAIFIKLAYGADATQIAVEPVTLLALRMAIALPFYLCIAYFLIKRYKRRNMPLPSKSLVLKAMATGLLGYYISSFLDFEGLKMVTAQLERLLLFTYPAFIMILGALFFGYPFTRYGLISIIIAYSGLVFIFTGGSIAVGSNVALGSGLIVLCAIIFALFQLIAKPLISKMGSGLFTCAAMISASFAVFTHFLVHNLGQGTLGTALNIPSHIWVFGAMIAVCSTLIPSFLINIALGRIGAQGVSMIGMMSPMATIIMAVVLLNEPFGFYDAIGTALTISGIGIYTLYDYRLKKRINIGEVKSD